MNHNILCSYTEVGGRVETAVTYLKWAEWFASDNAIFSLESTCRSKREKTKLPIWSTVTINLVGFLFVAKAVQQVGIL